MNFEFEFLNFQITDDAFMLQRAFDQILLSSEIKDYFLHEQLVDQLITQRSQIFSEFVYNIMRLSKTFTAYLFLILISK